jgi:hypothetical protein
MLNAGEGLFIAGGKAAATNGGQRRDKFSSTSSLLPVREPVLIPKYSFAN